jgi:uncharacterized protein involved in exopolysaccharide biosynthesis
MDGEHRGASASRLVTLPSIVAAVRERIRVPLLLAAIFLLLTFIYLWAATPLYEARVTISERNAEAQFVPRLDVGLGMDLLRGFGATTTMTPYDKLVELLSSSDTAERLQANETLMTALFPDSWDPEARRWQRPSGIVAGARELLNRTFGLPGWTQPLAEPVMDMLRDRLRIISNDSGRFHSISFRHRDPQVARGVVELSLKAADGLLRERDRRTVDENVLFLRERLKNEQLVDVRDVLSQQLGEQFVRGAMLANSAPYAYDILQSPVVSSRPVSPRPLFSIVLAVLVGIIVGCAWILLRAHAARKR